MLKIFNQSHEAVGYIKKSRDCKIESVLSTAEKTLSFTYLGKSGKIDYEYYVQTKDAEYVVKSIRITSDGYPEYTATLNMEELESKTWETFLAKDSSLRDTANLALAGTGWRVAECTVDKKRSMGLQNVTSKVVLQKICTVFMCEMQVDSKAKTVSFKEKFGEDKGVYFLQGLNLRKLTLSGDTYDFYTRIIPVGKDGLKITAVNGGKEYIDNFQYSKKIIPYIWQDTSYEDASALKEDAVEKLKDLSIPKKSYTVDVRDLAYRSAEYSVLEYNLGDTITLIDRKTGIRDKQRITKIVEYPGDPDKNTCDIANTRETFDEIQSRLKEAASIIEAVKNLDGSINGNAVDKVTTDQILGFKDGVESGIQASSTISGIKTDIKAVTADIGTIQSTYLKATDADIKFATIENLKATTATVHDLNADYAKFKTATANEFSAQTAQIKKLSGDFASFKTGDFESLKAKQADFETATAKNFTATSARIDTVTGDLASYKNVVAENFSAANGKIENLETTTLKSADAKLTYATIESLNALKGDITDLNVGSLTARVATIEGAYISKTETKQLLAGYADIKLANVAAGTIGSALIGDGAITDAKIASVSANKLTAGTIDASKINVMNMNAENLTVGTINGQRIGDKSIDLTKLSKEVPTKEYLDSVQNGLQNQIDSAIQTYTSDTIPTLKNSPAVSWTDNSTRAKHVGDICYVTNAGGNADGYCYRFTNTGTSANPVYEWVLIKDSDVNKALQELVTVNGDLAGLKSFQSETSSWRTSTDTEISSVKTRTTTIETTYSTKEETKSAADSAKSSAIESSKSYTDSAKSSAIESAKGYTDTAKTDAIESAKGYTDSAKTDAIASSKTYTDTATKDMATSTAVANAKKEAIATAASDATKKADAAKSEAISAASSDATKKADAAKSSAISAAATDATTKANTAKSEAISTAASDATKKANDAKSAAISAASSDATSKANTAKSEAISAAASDATNKANAALNSAKGYADDAVDNIAVGGRNLLVKTNQGATHWSNSHANGEYSCESITWLGVNAVKMGCSKRSTSWKMFTYRITVEQFKKLKPGGSYVLSYDTDGGSSANFMDLMNTNTSGPIVKTFTQTAIKTNYGYHYTIKIVLKDTLVWGNQVVYLENNLYHGISVIIANLKLEEGNKATPWTPAPEDTEEAINTKVSTTVFNEVKQTVDTNSATITKLSETVSKKADGSSVTTLSNTVNSIKQTADSNTAAISGLQTTVSKKADGSTVDSISKTLNTVKQTADSNTANISELSKTVSIKADGSSVTALTTRMSNAEQNLDGFKTTVSKTYVTSQTYEEKVSNLESGISAAQGTADSATKTANTAKSTADSAKSTADSATTTANTAKSTADTASKTASAAKSTAEGAVSTANTAKNTADSANKTASSAKSTADSAAATANSAKSTAEGAVSTANSAKSTADAAKSSVDGLAIGGRNLFRNTGVEHSNNSYLTAMYPYASEPLVAGETYTVTICVTPAEKMTHFYLYLSQGMQNLVALFVTGTKKQIISRTFTAKYYPGKDPSVNPDNGSACFYRFPDDGTVTSNTTIHWIKVEKGNKATDWTPAPEDTVDHQYAQYYRSTSTTTPTGGSWQNTVPDLLENTCIWTRQAIVHVGGDIEYSNPVLDSVTKKVVSMDAEVTKTAEGLTSTANKVTTLTNDLAGVTTRLGTAESKITQNAESISAKVSTTDFNSFQKSNTTAIDSAKNSAISTAASDATKKANDAKSAAISTAASDATTKANNAKSAAISTAASDATTKANAALSSAKSYSDGQIKTVNAAITQTNSEISAMKGQIALKVEQTDINKAVEGITVGGRNYIQHSDTWTSSGYASNGITKSIVDGVLKVVVESGNGNWHNFFAENTIESNFNEDDTFTFSVEIKSDDSTIPPQIYFKPTVGMGYRRFQGTVSKEYSWISCTGTWKKANGINFHFGWSDIVGTYYIRKIKFERGNKRTDWTPAPEDDEERLSSLESWKSEASLKITKDGIIGTVGSYYATGADVTALTGRVTQAESTIKQQSDSIALTIKKDGVISAINQTSESVKISANKISLTASGLVEIINSGDTKIKAANLNLSATDVVNIINKGTTKIEASKLNLSGYVTVSSLSGSGTTTIDGSNIKTGKISTDRLDVTAIFAKEVNATNLHVTGNSKIDGSLVTSGINASNITTGTISADRLDVNGIFAKDVTATGTIMGAFLKGSRLVTEAGKKGIVDITGDVVSANFSYNSNEIQEMRLRADGLSFGESIKNGNSVETHSYVSIDQNGLYIQDIVHLSRSAAQATFSCNVVTPSLGVNGSADINKDLRVYGSMRADGNVTTSTIELYAATPFIDFHFDGNNGDYTSRIIELESGKLNVNGVVCNSGAIWGTNIAIDGPGTFTKGITSKAESVFHTGSYTDPYPGKSCTIKSWGTVASLRFMAKGVGNTWLGAAKPDGAAYDTICTDANALVPGWRVRTADGAWVGASYAQDPGFRIYYCNASRLGRSTNGTDAIYTFGASGTFHAKSVSQTSDEREKNILSGITEKYENLFMRLKPILFNWKSGADGVHMGFGAQTTLDMAEKCGINADEFAAVHKSETEEPWSMSYTEIVPLTVQMTQKALLAVNSTREEMRKAITSIDSTRKEVSALGSSMTARMESMQYQLAQTFDRIATLEKENKSLRQALS